jgi:hypothetical protein
MIKKLHYNKYLRILLTAFILAVLCIPSLPLFHINLFDVPVGAATRDLYWIGGSGDWSDTANWSLTSGNSDNSSPQVVPDSDDNVYFDANSGFTGISRTVTMNSSPGYCLDMDWTGAPNNPIFNRQNNADLYIYGSLTLIASMTFDAVAANGRIGFLSTSAGETVTTAGVNLNNVLYGMEFAGNGGEWTLQDELTVSSITHTKGILDTNDQTINCKGFFTTGSNARELILGNSTINISNTGYFQYTGSNLTLGEGTSSIITDGTSGTCKFYGNGETYYDVQLINVHSLSTTDNSLISGANTFTTLSISGDASTGYTTNIDANQIITGTLTIAGDSAVNRLLIRSDTIGTARTLTAATVTVSNADFQDITGAGTASWNLSAITGKSGDCGGNSGITFTTADNMYWSKNNGAWTDPANWFLATNGGGGAGRVPLPQDTAIFDANSFDDTGKIVTIVDNYRVGDIDASGATFAPTFGSGDFNVLVYGSITWGAMDIHASIDWFFYSRYSETLTSASKTFPDITIGSTSGDGISGTLTLQDALTSSGIVTLNRGTLDFNDQNVTMATFDSSTNTYTRTLSMGDGEITVNSTAAVNKWNIATGSFTLNKDNSTLILTNSGTNAQSITGGGKTYDGLTIKGAGVYTLTFNDANTWNTMLIDRSEAAKTIAGNVIQTVTNLTIPVSGTTQVTITNVDFVKSSGTVALGYVTISGSVVDGVGSGAAFYAGATPPSVNGGSNSGWNFTEPSDPILTTLGASEVSFYTAKLNGVLDSMAGQPNGYISFQYSTDPAYPSDSTVVSSGEYTTLPGEFFYNITSGLSAGTTYYFRIRFYYGTTYAYGSTVFFTTAGGTGVPTVITGSATNPTSSTITLQGVVTDMGGYTTVNLYFDYGVTASYGDNITATVPTATDIGAFSVKLTNLQMKTTYHFRAKIGYIVSGVEIFAYGADGTFTTTITSGTDSGGQPLPNLISQIFNGGVFSSFLESNDLLFIAEIANTYADNTTNKYYPNGNISKLFVLQLVNTDGSTVLAQVPLRDWGLKPISIYMNASTSSNMTLGENYILRLHALFTASPPTDVDYTLQDDDWYGNDMNSLDFWCVSVAGEMNTYYSLWGKTGSMLTNTIDKGAIISQDGTGYFVEGIPEIDYVRPDLFYAVSSKPIFTTGTGTNAFAANHIWTSQVGTKIAADFTTFGGLFDVNGSEMMGWLIGLIIIFIVIFCVSQGSGALGGLVLCVPFLIAGNLLGAIGIQITVVGCILCSFFFIRQFIIKTL